MRPSKVLPLLAFAAAAACAPGDEPLAPRGPLNAPSANQSLGRQDLGYIVTFDDSVADVPGLARALANRHGASPQYTYRHAIKGFSAKVSAGAAAALARHPGVRRVEADGIAEIVGTQPGATWGLDRLDQVSLPLSSTYTYNYTGAGVTAYIIDTGLRIDHTQFGNRASIGFDGIGDGQNGNDCHGHGTHVGGTVGGTVHGVAKNVQLIAVRVLGCGGSGSWSGIIAGLDWIVSHHGSGPAVGNMSLGGGLSSSVNDAVRRAINDGVVMALAAGNSNADACLYSPAATQEAITVGASDAADNRASFSNWGTCVDWFAPGVSITSAYYSSTTATAVMSGTSMASPHVAGAAALYLEANPTASPENVRDGLYSLTTKGKIAGANSANNHLLHTLGIAGGVAPSPPTQPPPPSGILLTVTPYKVKGMQKVDLSWSGATGAMVDIWRNGTFLVSTANDEAYTDAINRKGGGSYTYKVCEAGTATCSAGRSATF
jgi:subtilisin family serine protease